MGNGDGKLGAARSRDRPSDGETLCGRFAVQDSAGLRAGRRQPAAVGPAVSSQCELGREDSSRVAAHGEDGTHPASSRTQAQVHRSHSPATARLAAAAAGFNPGGVAGEPWAAGPARRQPAGSVGGAAGHGVASEKKSLYAQERDSEANRERRAEFAEKLASQFGRNERRRSAQPVCHHRPRRRRGLQHFASPC